MAMIMNKVFVSALLVGSAIASPAMAQSGAFQKIAGGVAVTPASGPSARVEVTVHGDGIIHVVATPRDMASGPLVPSLMAPNPPAAGKFTVQEQGATSPSRPPSRRRRSRWRPARCASSTRPATCC